MSNWQKVCALAEIPVLGARVVKSPDGDIAVFRNAADEVFAVHDRCPHRGGPLSQGIVTGRVVVCPLHSWKIQLENGEAMAPDTGCAGAFAVKVEDGCVYLQT